MVALSFVLCCVSDILLLECDGFALFSMHDNITQSCSLCLFSFTCIWFTWSFFSVVTIYIVHSDVGHQTKWVTKPTLCPVCLIPIVKY